MIVLTVSNVQVAMISSSLTFNLQNFIENFIQQTFLVKLVHLKYLPQNKFVEANIVFRSYEHAETSKSDEIGTVLFIFIEIDFYIYGQQELLN